ncbi:MAG: amidohydrolase family protein [Chloroflexi bacterium]|nr:amidohydrolase family protein [Chloroflexota bacterium]MBP7045474.1 amidohydrolase family protein [Chloroflexota bacterium]
MKIDAHQHFWQYNAREYGWMGPGMERLQRDHLPEDLRPFLTPFTFDGTIAVQARQTLEETRWLLDLADRFSFIKGVVGWVDLRGDDLRQQLDELAQHPKLVGVRHVLHDEPDDAFMLREDFQRGLSLLADYNLVYDLLLFPHHLPAACKLVGRFPNQPFVLDHIAKPLIRDGRLTPWADDLPRLAAFPNVACKVSGLVTEANWQTWQPADFRPYLDVVFAAFGTDRLMFGSDWPVCTVAGSYEQVVGLAADYVAQFSAAEQTAVFGATASRIYGVQ